MHLVPSVARNIILGLGLAKAGKLLKPYFLQGSERKATGFPVKTLGYLGLHQPGVFGNLSCCLRWTNEWGSQISMKEVKQWSTLLLSNLAGGSKLKLV